MNRWSLGIVTAVGLMTGMEESARAQVFYAYDAPVYSTPAYVPSVVYQSPFIIPARTVVTAGYAAPYTYSAPFVVQQPIAQMVYSTPVIVPVQTVVAAPVLVARPTIVRETTRSTRHNYTHTVRVDGPTDGPRYSRVHVHSGLFGTTVRERVR